MDRVYVCHTYYHVLISIVKELLQPAEAKGKATLILSLMSTDFENLKERIEQSGLFHEVLYFDEKNTSYFPELVKLKENKGNIVLNLLARMKYTKRMAELLEPYVPVDFRNYKEIYVYCDGDPIGIYLNQKKIRYHALEDGLDTLRPYVQAKYDNRGGFKLKKFMSMKLNLIFMCDGYSKYCMDMEVNDISCIDDDFDKYVEVPRQELFDRLTQEQQDVLVRVFVRDYDSFAEMLGRMQKQDKSILILTEPLCSLDVREQIFRDLIEEYQKEGTVFLKPHPRDVLDYASIFPEVWTFDKSIPMEIFRFFHSLRFQKLVSVYTQLANVNFAEEKVYLGHDFMDKYEDPGVHRKEDLVKSRKG